MQNAELGTWHLLRTEEMLYLASENLMDAGWYVVRKDPLKTVPAGDKACSKVRKGTFQGNNLKISAWEAHGKRK